MVDRNSSRTVGWIVSAASAVMIAVGVGTGETHESRHQPLLEQQPSVYPDQDEIEAAKRYRVDPRDLLQNDPFEGTPADDNNA